MIDPREQIIIDFIKKTGTCSSKEVHEKTNNSASYATTKRVLAKIVSEKYLATVGKGKGTKYMLSPTFELLEPVQLDKYYEKEIDEREITKEFNFSLINEVLANHSVFKKTELTKLNELQEKFQKNISQLSEAAYKKEFERLAIDLSWKSSQIEGNTYSLLETERLLKERDTLSSVFQNGRFN